MCEGGIYDQLGGGFCRYSVDAQWQIPHFEKMLYDNGPLLGLLADAWLVSARTAIRALRGRDRGLDHARDAIARGRLLLLARRRQRARGGQVLRLGSRGGAATPCTDEEYAAYRRAFRPRPAAELREPALAPARRSPAHRQICEAAKQKLFAAREKRIRPGRDEKILVSWNALAIRGMAHAGRVFGREDWIASARRAFEFIRAKMWRDGRLLATYKDGRAHLNAYLDDYAFLIAAALELLQARLLERRSRLRAAELADVLLAQFEDSRARRLLLHRARPRAADPRGPSRARTTRRPSGNAVAALALGAARRADRRRALCAARRGARLELFYPAMRDYPAGFAAMALALEEQLEPPTTLILRGGETALGAWHVRLGARISSRYSPARHSRRDGGLAAAARQADRGREAVNGWVCRGVTCLEPIAELATLIKDSQGEG